MRDSGEKWWEAVKTTVTPLDEPGAKRRRRRLPAPEPLVLDLHGLSVQAAYEATLAFMEAHKGRMTIITGKSGQIKQEFPRWLEGLSGVRSVTENGNGGSYEIRLGNRRKARPR